MNQKNRDESRISGTGWVFLSKQLWGAGGQGVRCVKKYQGYCGPGVQGIFSKTRFFSEAEEQG